MRMVSFAHDFRAIWQAKVCDRPFSHRHFTLAVLCLGVAMVLIGSPVRAKEPQSRCARIGQKWADFWNSRDVKKATNVFTKDIVYEDVSLGVVADGAEAFQAFAQGFFDAFPQATFTVVNSSCRGQQGFLEWSISAKDGRVDPPAPGFCGTGKTVGNP